MSHTENVIKKKQIKNNQTSKIVTYLFTIDVQAYIAVFKWKITLFYLQTA